MAQTKELTNFYYISLTEKGPVREKNEDYPGYFDTVNGHVFVVCDGIGGNPYGDLASQTAVNALKFFFSNYYYQDAATALKDALAYAQNEIFQETIRTPQAVGMGTTVIAVLIRYNKVWYAHEGDSRLYLLHNNALTQLTQDHSYVNLLIKEGKITPKEAKSHPRRNEITRALGMHDAQAEICSHYITTQNNDLLILCTDGLYNPVKFKELQNILSARMFIENKGKKLIEAAVNNGGTDNITLQIIKFYNIEQPIELAPENNLKTDTFFHSLQKKYKIRIALLLLIILALAGIKYLRNDTKITDKTTGKSIDSTQNIDRYVKFKIDFVNIDSLLSLYNVSPDNVLFYQLNNEKFVSIPVKKIHKIRYYDNLNLLCRLYSADSVRILRINNLNSLILTPDKQLIIPY